MSGLFTPGERENPWSLLGDHDKRIRSLEAVPPGSGGSGIQFDTYPQSGDWLSIDTTDAGGVFGAGVNVQATAGGINMQAVATIFGGGGVVLAATGDNNNGTSFGAEGDNGAGMTSHVSGDDNGGYSVLVEGTGNAGLSLRTNDDGPITVDGDDTVNIHADGMLTVDGDALVYINGDGGILMVGGNGNPVLIAGSGGTTEAMVQIRIVTAGNYFTVCNNTPIEQFRIQPQGTDVLTVMDSTGTFIFQIKDGGDVHMKAGASIIYDL